MEDLVDVTVACRILGGTTPIHRATLFRGVKSGRFSPPIKIGAKSARWRRSELLADIERLAAQREEAA
jgi:predicted DNA-binding transcriptional regulator AlpA